MKICHACKKELELGRSVGRRDTCPACKADLTCCLNCAFHDRHASKQCREPMVENVKLKERANFCDYFRFSDTDADDTKARDDAARNALNALFGK